MSIFVGQWFAQKPKRIKDDRSLMQEEKLEERKGTQADYKARQVSEKNERSEG